MNSYNHYAFGAVVYWFYHNLAGIQPDITAPGFEKITLAPEFYRELSPIHANYSSRRGKISAKWNFEEDKVNYEVLTPAGTTSTLKLPSIATSISIDDKLLNKIKKESLIMAKIVKFDSDARSAMLKGVDTVSYTHLTLPTNREV